MKRYHPLFSLIALNAANGSTDGGPSAAPKAKAAAQPQPAAADAAKKEDGFGTTVWNGTKKFARTTGELIVMTAGAALLVGTVGYVGARSVETGKRHGQIGGSNNTPMPAKK